MRNRTVTIAQPRRRYGAVITLVLVLLIVVAATRAMHMTSGTAAPIPSRMTLDLDGNYYNCTMNGKTLVCAYIQH